MNEGRDGNDGAESAKPSGFQIQQATISPHPHGNTLEGAASNLHYVFAQDKRMLVVAGL